MSPQEQSRFEMLRAGDGFTPEYFTDYYGISWPLQGELATDFEMWTKRLKRRLPCGEGLVPRVEFESFLEKQKLIPKKFLAADMGMQPESLDAILVRLPELGMRVSRYLIYPNLIAKPFSADLIANVPRIQKNGATDDASRLRMHEELENIFQIKIEPLMCATSEKLHESPIRLALDYDTITLEPVSGKHQIWLNFGKPNYLTTDRCSRLFFVENRETLGQFYYLPVEPDDLDRYELFLAAGQNV